MSIEMPRLLKNMNLFVDGRGYAGRVDEVENPKLSLKTEEHRAGGMDLPVEVELGMEKLEASLTFSDYDPELFKLFGLLDDQDVQLTLRGAFQRQGEAAVGAVCQIRGGWKEIDPGSWKGGDKSVLKVQVALSYYKLTMDGDNLVEVDAKNLVRKIGDKDQMESIRAAIGL